MKPLLSNFSVMFVSTTSSYLSPAAFGSDFEIEIFIGFSQKLSEPSAKVLL